jgi:hypothetical protein
LRNVNRGANLHDFGEQIQLVLPKSVEKRSAHRKVQFLAGERGDGGYSMDLEKKSVQTILILFFGPAAG